MTQSALMKERRELKEQQERSELEAIPKDLSRPWEDPMAEKVWRGVVARSHCKRLQEAVHAGEGGGVPAG